MPNRLSRETSPYLRQHADNPVDWFPWGEEALQKARAEDKPILLSIGYAACHWCHVMAHESFEDEGTAAVMNERFVSIKVDREERPDLDQIYMTAVHGMTGHGGWPMTVFLTPEGKPFFGGTYFPPADRGGMPAFGRVLISVSDAYRNERPRIEDQAGRVANFIREQTLAAAGDAALGTPMLDSAAASIIQSFEGRFGGFGSAPKFPQAMALDFLLRHYRRTGDDRALEVVEYTLQKMAHGGIYDHLGGGFHRYSVDAQWLVPHFEKMLYDNALLARAYLHTYQITGGELYRRIAEEILDYVRRDMTSPHGGFYSTEDADSEHEEGKFYVWTPDELDAEVGPEAAPVLRDYFGVRPGGNFEGKTILTVDEDVEGLMARHGLSVEQLAVIVAEGSARLFEVRSHRVRPGRDEKIIAAWNGFMLRAFAEGARVLDRPEDLQTAEANARFLLNTMWRDGHMLRIHKDGETRIPGYLEDYAGVADGLLALYEATFDLRWYEAARAIADAMVDLFWDEAAGMFFDSARDSEALVARPRDVWDNATPSGTSLAANVLLRLWALTGDPEQERSPRTVLTNMAGVIAQHGLGFGNLLAALDLLLAPPQEVAIIGDPGGADTTALRDALRREYLPNAVLAAAASDDQAASSAIPLLRDRGLVGGRAAAYVCRGFVCDMPVTEPSALLTKLR